MNGVQFADASLTFTMFTMPWTRWQTRRLVLYGKGLGLHVDHEHDGGWTLRYHVITATGPDTDVRRFSATVVRWQRLKAGKPADRDRELADFTTRLNEEST